ncbi:unnamed protein product [Blepharisma stoltei]|uniref:Protein Asterix n=1 Tax=Blepharisma stoltei TaxID=1481888 RepID=A0AAU9JZ52_9CILI|nr:unnamed protein product [Blepharisma stoltei]
MKGDPRRPSNVIYYKQTIDEKKETPPDYYHFIAVLFAMFGFMFKSKWGGWLALLTFCCGFTSARSQTTDYGQLITTFSMIIVSLVTNYMWIFKS